MGGALSMTTQDIYAWVQMGLQIVIGGGIVVGISRYFGILRRSIESQKATIEAQAEQMKAQSTVLQDVERLNKVMQQVIAFFDPQAQLQREQAYKERFERDMKAWEETISNAYGTMISAIRDLETNLARRREDTLWLKESTRELEEMHRQIRQDNQVLQEMIEDRNHIRTRSSPTAGAIEDQP
jgi:uncharacterized membrane protein YgaE (UPF0421/DUF939 family)